MGGVCGQGEVEVCWFVVEGVCVVIVDVLDDVGWCVVVEFGDVVCFQYFDVMNEVDWYVVVQVMFVQFGWLDIFVNNVVILKFVLIEVCLFDDYCKVIDVNQVGCWFGMKLVLVVLKDVGGGLIVNVLLMVGMEGVVGGSVYVLSKFVVCGMMKVVVFEFGCYGICVNLVYLGGIDMVMVCLFEFVDFDLLLIYSGLLIVCIGKFDEVVSFVLFFVFDEFMYCMGLEFIVDGGLFVGSMFY